MFSSAVIAGLLLSVAPATVQAASTASSAPKTTNVNPKAVIENDPKLTKQGYVLRIKNSKDADPIYVGKNNYKYALTHYETFKGKTISPAKVQNVKFRVEKVGKSNVTTLSVGLILNQVLKKRWEDVIQR